MKTHALKKHLVNFLFWHQRGYSLRQAWWLAGVTL